MTILMAAGPGGNAVAAGINLMSAGAARAADAAVPGISTPEAFKQTLLNAKSKALQKWTVYTAAVC